MKKIPRKILSTLLAVSTAASLLLTPLAAVIGSDLYVYDTQVQTGTVLTHGVYWGATAKDKRTENFITYTPSAGVTPIVTYGNYVASTSTVSNAAKKLEQAGYRVVAGMNGDYYYTANGVPMGMIVTDGILRSGYNYTWAIGFMEDGTAIMGDPKLSINMNYTYTVTETVPAERDTSTENESEDEGNGENEATNDIETETAQTETVTREVAVKQSIYTVNKARSNSGIFLYTHDFNAKGTTGNTEAGIDVVLAPADSSQSTDLRIGSTLNLVVESVTEKTGATTVPAGKIVLSANKKASETHIAALKNMKPGMKVSLSISAASGWEKVQYATSGYKKLLENGQVSSGLDSTGAPRTAIGQKADGTLVFYTIDGRKSGHSVGASESLLAQRLQQLGCVKAICLDGGGSTTMTATLPDSTTAQTINKPSDGSERAVSTHIFLVSDGTPTGELSHYYIQPITSPVLSGATVQLNATAMDTNYIPMSANKNTSNSNNSAVGDGELLGGITLDGENNPMAWSATSGSIDETGLYTAPAQNSTATITVSDGTHSGSTTIQTVANPESLVARVDGTVITALNTQPGNTHSLILSATYNHMTLISQNRCFRFAVTGNIGTITEDGVFTATQNGKGEIVISAGTTTLRIPVTVRSLPFTDVSDESWYYDAVQYVYENGLMQGSSATTFQPTTTTSRSMIVQILYNKEGQPTTIYSGLFADVPKGMWYTNAVEWAAHMDIVSGNGANLFLPDGAITREQMAVILYNYAVHVGYDTRTRSDLSTYSDSSSIHDWASEAMRWCVDTGLLKGSNNTLNPLGTASRAEIAQVLMNFNTIFGA